ncbi:oligopeptide ABC transporter substrate-binding protein [Lactobacillus sp. ESL0731]|uniref:oligopeptide ABC transporter substrate-binding protein n=1 Tax=unclassified Lactobacillus TaxID=2620435 RepID=UPI0023F899CF|nr:MULTISPECIES: oligopeptide ABC transporter substrate-binding protein [unclassified Lactobacillus]WEV50516.1 oligopeptide ABC transporter substrate-binding protein [Lactobacillus sp. ESL0700]WEV61646.1 oligopeptide ABC transporter substrate-binding protein [Lactobacillus sp. ESL0731]
MRKFKTLSSLGIITTAALVLTACGKSSDTANESKSVSKLPESTPVKATKQGGTLKLALETDTPFSGIFSNELSTSDIDSEVASPGAETLFDTDNHYRITDKGPATLKLNRKNNTVTITVKKGVKWSDGKQVTAKDLEYPYEIIANKTSKSERYNKNLENILGLKDYHDGKASSISGIEMPNGENGRTIIIHFYELKPGMYNSGNRYFWETAEPYHYLKNVPFSKLVSSDQIRKKPLFFGPFKAAKVTRGQSVTWTPNKYYWRGKPKLNKIILQVVTPNSATQAIKSHKFDVADIIPTQWMQVKDTKNVNFIAQIPLAYHYIGFKVGKWDAKQNKNVMNKNAKMNNKALRQAIGYAMNVDQVDKHYTHGIKFRVPTLIPAQYGDYSDQTNPGFNFNLKKANNILDKAGFKKKGKWRTQPNGKPLTITFAAMSGDTNQEPIVQNYLQQWHKIGLNVKLAGGRLTEFNSFYDKIQNDDPTIDMYMAGWGLPSEPSPQSYYSETSILNYMRYVTPENNKLLREIDSPKAFNHKYRVQKFHEWQKYMAAQAWAIPIDNAYTITAVNSDITGYSKEPAQSNNNHPLWYKVGFVK